MFRSKGKFKRSAILTTPAFIVSSGKKSGTRICRIRKSRFRILLAWQACTYDRSGWIHTDPAGRVRWAFPEVSCLFVGGGAVEERARSPQKRQFCQPQHSVLRAPIPVRQVNQAIVVVAHEVHYFQN